jgi:hypothetical protein
MWIAIYAVSAWLVASVVTCALLALLFAGVRRGRPRVIQLPPDKVYDVAVKTPESAEANDDTASTGWPARSGSTTTTPSSSTSRTYFAA